MGNSLGCVGLGERLAAAAKDGDAAEAQRLLAANPGLARCTTFGNLNSPLHVAAAKGHHEIAALLLENGADVNARNIYGQVSELKLYKLSSAQAKPSHRFLTRINIEPFDRSPNRPTS